MEAFSHLQVSDGVVVKMEDVGVGCTELVVRTVQKIIKIIKTKRIGSSVHLAKGL